MKYKGSAFKTHQDFPVTRNKKTYYSCFVVYDSFLFYISFLKAIKMACISLVEITNDEDDENAIL